MNTDRLIERLAREAMPAGPLRSPTVRAAAWLFWALVYVGLLTFAMTSRADLAANGGGWRFVLPQLLAVLLAATSAVAAFASTVPGVSRRALLLPILAGSFWLGNLILGQEWSQVNAASLAAPGEWQCVAMIALGAALPGLGITIMLRRGAPLTPRRTAALGALAVAVLANVGACISHPHPSNAVTLLWHGATILVLVALASWGSRLVLTWGTREVARG
ncbi:MAG TPA: NrsF family protein [Vicinamibacterales bacterium]|nr:NrsF family protein [Vicinamibacterales bacterium]